jgi:predicted anti-sigma-YlaC factor YlaD
MTGLVCRVSRTTLMARVLDTGRPPAVLEGHVTACLRCQATVARALRLRRMLARLAVPAEGAAPDGSATPLGWVAAALASLVAAIFVLRLRQQGG